MASPTLPSIRPGRDTDGPALARLISAVFSEYEGCPYVPEEFPELAAPASHYAGKGGALWVAENDAGEVVGSLAVAKALDAGTYELFKVYVAAGQRGTGLAQTLLEGGYDFIRSHGGERVVLWSDTRFLSGHRFYRRNGFRRVPGIRALHDAADTLEFGFARDCPGVDR
ncbi:GNAT family N-acetyltransferase [uncultured Alsobacter sp.]|uniref:GNAT family N-acetyltransferase n=1 Tax=uncultured Alsobacter sp. TaxID=1748258 RepID=UPI0025CEB051|nr:GNAT family N-acetyltransferase [uncultured Alsobacter sp.]